MQYLVDTNVFNHTINSNIYGVAALCKDKGNDVCITQTILDELEPGYYRENEDASSREVCTCVNNLISGSFNVIKLVHIEDVPGAKEELKWIRKKFYDWMRDPVYLHDLVSKGIITKEDIRKPSFRNKDLGECELIAIVKASKGTYWLVTNDLGRVYAHPDQNIYDTYKDDPNVVILSGEDWISEIGYSEE